MWLPFLARMKQYRILNNILGWVAFLIAAVTYMCTLEPTASFWDCPEFISQGYKLEIGHPPGNPIITFLQCNVKRFCGFIHFDNLKVLYHFFRQNTFRQLYIRILFHRSLF